MVVRARTTHHGSVMTAHRRAGIRAPVNGLIAAVLALLLLPSLASGADWTPLDRVSAKGGSRLDSLHQLAGSGGMLHLVHPRLGPRKADDRVVYQRSVDRGRSWTRERVVFAATRKRRYVVPNLAVDARGAVVAVAFRVRGPKETVLLVRVSRDGGQSFGGTVALAATGKSPGIGVPAVAVGSDFVAVAWTNRVNGKVKLRVSRNDGRTFGGSQTLATTKLSIDCKDPLTDGLVGLAANGKSLHVAWSHSASRHCIASAVRVRTSLDRGASWSPVRTITERDSFGWPELDARGKTVVATVQGLTGELILARSGANGRKWRERTLKPPKGFLYSAADVLLLPHGKAAIAYVKERVTKDVMRSTRLVTRHSRDDGVSYGKPKPVTKDAKLLRMAPNLAANDGRLSLVVQSGQLDGTPRHIHDSRLR